MKGMGKLGVGIIGLGMASLPHARALRELGDEIEVVNAFSPSPERRAAFAKAHGFPVCGRVEMIFGDPRVGAVLILTPPNTHLDLVRMAAVAGKHVLLEKPIEIGLERAEQLVAEAATAGIQLGIVLQNRFRPAAQKLRTLMTERGLGEIVQVSAQTRYWRPQSYYDEPGRGTFARDGGGVLMTQAIHNLDLMLSLVGLPESVAGFVATSPIHRMEGEDMTAAILRFANGAIGSVAATTCAFPGHPDLIEIVGEKGSASLCGTRLCLNLHDGTGTEFVGEDSGSGSGADPMGFSCHAHKALIADFAAAIAAGRRPAASGQEVLAVHRLIDAIMRSNGQLMRL